MNQRTFLIIAISIFLILSCNFMNKKDKLYEYNVGPSAARGYVAQIISGSYLGNAIIPSSGAMRASWGMSSVVVVAGDGKYPVPDTISIYFYSYVEDQFYQAVRPLPKDYLTELLEASYPDTKNRTLSYYDFTVSVAPCGWVSVWLGGSAGSLEICSFRAEKIELDYEKVFPQRNVSREEARQIFFKGMFSFIQKEITENKVSSEYWENLSKKYKWKLSVNDPEFEVYDYMVNMINIERRYYASNGNWLTDLNEKSIPVKIVFYLKHDKDPLRYKVRLILAESWDPEDNDKEKQTIRQMSRNRELMKIFEDFYAEAGDEEVNLFVEFDNAMQSAQVKLKTATKERIIEGCRIEGIFDSDRYMIDD